MKGLFITGTDTDVGKTYASCLIAAKLSASGFNVIPRKPVESGCLRNGDKLIPHDASALLSASNYSGSLRQVCPFRFEQAISPQRAAQLNNQIIHLDELLLACEQGVDASDESNDFLLVEGAGGFYSPLCEDGLNADLAEALNLPVVLVAEDKVGCINQVLLSVEAISSRNLNIHSIILNRTEKQPETPSLNNSEDLSRLLSYPLLNLPFEANNIEFSVY